MSLYTMTHERDADVIRAMHALRGSCKCYDIANQIAKPWCRLPNHGRVNYSAIVASLKRVGAIRDSRGLYRLPTQQQRTGRDE